MKYHIQVNGKMVAVCKKIFQNIYGIGHGRVDVIIKKKASIPGISHHLYHTIFYKKRDPTFSFISFLHS